MTLKETFPLLHNCSIFPDDPRWNEMFYYDQDSFEKVNQFVREHIRPFVGDIEKVSSIATAVCKDIRALPRRPEGARLMADFLQFQICTMMMNIAATKRLNVPLFHWIANSVSDTIDEDDIRNVMGGWILAFSQSDSAYIKEYFKIEFIQWTRQFFYFMRVMGGHQQLTAYYLDNLLDLFFGFANRAFYYLNYDIAIGQILTWASNTGHIELKKNAARINMYLYDSLGYPEEWRKNIEFGFACTGFEYTDRTQKEWIDLVFKKRVLNGHERLQLLALKYQDSTETVKQNFLQITDSIDEYHRYIDQYYEKEQIRNYELSRIFNLLKPLLLTLLKDGDVATTNLLIGRYFKISKQQLVEPSSVVITPGTLEGVQYTRQGAVISSGENPYEHASELMIVCNAFLGWTGVMTDDLSFNAEIPERGEGIPDKSFGPELENRIVKYYGFDQQKILEFLMTASGYYLFGNYQLPLQPLMVKYGKFSLPMIQSFKKTKQARLLKKVFMWQGDSTSSEMECDAVQQLFGSKGIEVYRLNWHQSSKEEFLATYRLKEFDLVWISGHGEFDQFKPHLSCLVLNQDFSEGVGKNITVDYDEIEDYDGGELGRRLLVLNICDGATTTLDNSPAAIGLGSKMINDSQSLISHQWPIEPFAGMITGILLAKALAAGESYKDSYGYAIKTGLSGKEAIVKWFQEEFPNSELADIIERNSSVDYSNIYFYGSLIYAE